MNLPLVLPQEAGQRSRLQALGAMLLVALAYYFSGRLGLLLAIPPGYATAVWPASGIALAAAILRGAWVLPGIWAGSFALNVVNGFDAGSARALLQSLGLPALIGIGAAAQAGIGAALVRRLVGYRNLLEQETAVVPLLALGGPLACLISASFGVGTLYARGLIPEQAVLFNWWTWWVGDTIGVLIFTPLVLVWSLRPWSLWLRRQLQVTLPLAGLFAAVVALFVIMSAREQARVRQVFEDWVHDIGLQIATGLDKRMDALQSLRGLYASSEQVTREEFRDFASLLLEQRPGLIGLSWNPLVAAGERADFEQRMRSEQGAYGVFDFVAATRRPAPARAWYAPVAYMIPEQENAMVPGLDVLSEPSRAAAALRARDSGKVSASVPVRLVQRPESGSGVVIFAPIYTGATLDTVESRREHLAGYVTAVFEPARLIPLMRGRKEGEMVEVTVTDVTDPARPLPVYRSAGAGAKAGLSARGEIDVGGRRWQVDYALPEQYLMAHRSWEVWALLAGGMLFTGLLGMFLLMVIGRDARVAQLVDERTAQLQEVNRSLAREAARSDRFETESRARADQIAATNRELEQFAFVVSHDLQAPLRNIQSFAKLLDKRHGAALADEAREYLEYLRASATDMSRMIEDLLQLSRVNPRRASITRLRSADALAAALGNLRSDLEARGAQIEQGELPEVFGDLGLLSQLFQNLVGNAIKFQRPGVAPRVRISAELARGEWRFAVADNGIGISEKNIGRLFQIFRRLHTAEEYPGTGIGLALCRKIAALHGGRIWVESKLGEGTTVFFALPLQGPPPEAAMPPPLPP